MGEKFTLVDTYDAENKQKSVSGTGGTIGTYFYDGDGKRVKKVSNTETTIFVYDAAGKLVAEYSNQINSNPQVSYLTQDNLGSPRITTDANGNTISRRDFHPFGEEVFTAQRTQGFGYTVDNVKQKFTGYQKDEETQLDFAEARYYNNAHGRFTAVDPLLASGKSANPQTFNRYAYVMNNPLKYTDPTGLQAGEVIQAPTAYTLAKERLNELGAALYNKINELLDQGHSPQESFRIAKFAQDAPLNSVKKVTNSETTLTI